LWFVNSKDELVNEIHKLLPYATRDGLWIIWPKKSVKKTGLSQTVVRKAGMELGLVDYKICSVDKKWSGLRFIKKKSSNNFNS
jgi:hypothetical protein